MLVVKKYIIKSKVFFKDLFERASVGGGRERISNQWGRFSLPSPCVPLPKKGNMLT